MTLLTVSNLTDASPGEGSSLCLSVSYLVSYVYLPSHSHSSLPSLGCHYNEVYYETSTYKFSKRKTCLAIRYQHLRQVGLTAGAADVNSYCTVNSSKQVAGQFPCQRYLSVYTSLQVCKGFSRDSGRFCYNLWGPAVF